MKYLIANLKAHHSFEQIQEWVKVFSTEYHPKEGWYVGIAPSAPHLSYVQTELHNLQNVVICAQSVSSEAEGSFTGEVTAAAIRGLVSHSLTGHSERRSRGETNEVVQKQIQNLSAVGIQPILCIATQEQLPAGYDGIVAYEPPSLIGTGTTALVDEVISFRRSLGAFSGMFLYGASVDENTCNAFTTSPEVQGFLVGTAAVNPRQFLSILQQL